MQTELNNLEPKKLWQYFAKICEIPHPSKHEEQIAKFVQNFGNKLGLETNIDNVGNVLIKKPATSGMETHKTIVLQAHLDMVPQKNKGVDHDFTKDSIKTYIDGEWITAKDTTLGADNGIGVAAIMAVLETKDIAHGPIEALFTIDEETGMTGAFGLKKDILKGDVLLNLDTEVEGEFFIGCAGGINTDIKLKYSETPPIDDVEGLKLSISGLKGGHSGCDIHLGRGNANKIISRLLWEAGRGSKFNIGLSELHGGDLHNAIPREAYAIITVHHSQKNDFINFAKKFIETVKNEYSSADPNLKLKIDKIDALKAVMSEQIQKKLLNAIYICPNGVLTMSKEVHGLVETSTNLASINAANGNIEILTSQRSSITSLKHWASNMVNITFQLIGAEIKSSNDYPGWKADPNSSIVKLMQKIYKEKFGKDPKIKALHAGLECGLIGAVYPNLDMISFGPTILNAHSPDEKVHITSVKKFWDLLIATLENI